MVVAVLKLLVFIDIFPLIQELCHWLILVGIRISVTKFFVNDGLSLLIP